MVRFKQWVEGWGPEVTSLKGYLKDKPIDLANFYQEFGTWKRGKEILRGMGLTSEKLEKIMDDDPDRFYEIVYKIEDSLTDEEKDQFMWVLQQMNPAEAPSWGSMDYSRVVTPNEWLVHFSDYAWDIWKEGFTKGAYDASKLSLTTWMGDWAKRGGGYNFAFVLGGSYAMRAAWSRKYGKDAVIFKAGGVQAYHHGDEEDQVIFWGRSVDPRSTIYLRRDGNDDWCVVPRVGNRECLRSGNFQDVTKWIVTNYHQYRKVL